MGASDLDDAVERNVRATIDTVRKDSPLLDDAEKAGEITIAGAVYDIKTSTVRFL
ncbi:MAG: carbonic anhydrase [Mycobacterium sp.]